MLDSLIRTFVPIVVGALLGWAAAIGLDLPEGAVSEIVTVAITFGYYAFARFLEQHVPAVGRVLLSLGLVDTQPTYRSVR